MVELKLIIGENTPKTTPQSGEIIDGRIQVFVSEITKEQAHAIVKYSKDNRLTVRIVGE